MVRREFLEVVFCSLHPRFLSWFLAFPWFDFPPFPLLGPTFRFYSPLLGILPADDDTAQYLSEALATPSEDQKPRRSASDVKNALEEARTRKETTELGYEDHVYAALSILGVS